MFKKLKTRVFYILLFFFLLLLSEPLQPRSADGSGLVFFFWLRGNGRDRSSGSGRGFCCCRCWCCFGCRRCRLCGLRRRRRRRRRSSSGSRSSGSSRSSCGLTCRCCRRPVHHHPPEGLLELIQPKREERVVIRGLLPAVAASLQQAAEPDGTVYSPSRAGGRDDEPDSEPPSFVEH